MEVDLNQLAFPSLPTKKKRELRHNFKKAVFENNMMAKRLVWVRETLGLRAVDVYSKINMPSATFCDREAGARTYHYEEIKVLADFYNELWQEKFLLKGNFPKYEGREISQVTIPWVMFGEDRVYDQMQKTIETLAQNHRDRERELSQKILELQAGGKSA